MNAKDIIDKMTEDDVIKVLTDLGSSYPIHRNDGLLFQTVCHCGNKKKLHYHRDNKSFFCYSNCGSMSNIFSLVMQTKSYTFKEAYKYIVELLDIQSYGSILRYGFRTESIDNSFINKFEIQKEQAEKMEIRDSSVLNRFRRLYHHSWIDDHISIEVMQLFNIRFDVLNNCIIIPHYDQNGSLLGIRARYLDQEMIDAGKKYMPITIDDVLYNYPTSLNLYGLNINKENIIKYKRVVIGEAEKFVMQHRSYYEDSVAVALNGSSLSDYQVNMLLDLGVNNVVLALDKEFSNQEEEEKYKDKINRSFISKLIQYFTVEVVWDTKNLLDLKDSPLDKGKEIYEQLYDERIIIS